MTDWADPTEEMLKDPLFDAIWRAIKRWDINVPEAYAGYCSATGNHARVIFEAVQPVLRQARMDALEEAARAAEREGVYPELNVCHGGPDWYRHGKGIAAAIRALKDKQP